MESLAVNGATSHFENFADIGNEEASASEAASRPEQFVFLLLPEFTHLALSCAIEPLRIANLVSGKELYRWTLVASNARSQIASCGIEVGVHSGLQPLREVSRLIVVSGQNVARHLDAPTLEYVRRVYRHGTPLGGICSGAYVLARAGLMNGKKCAIHWEFHAGFRETFPAVILSSAVFVSEEPVITASGGPAAADLMLRLIADRHGLQLAQMVADQMVYSAARDSKATQRPSFSARYANRSRPLSKALALMEQNLEVPLGCAEIAFECGVTIRQLQRLFLKFVGCSPCRVYHEMRLRRAQSLLRQTDLSIIDVALACGFQSPTNFSRNYRKMFGRRPSLEALV